MYEHVPLRASNTVQYHIRSARWQVKRVVQYTKFAVATCGGDAVGRIVVGNLKIQVKIQPGFSLVFVNSLMNYVVFCFLANTEKPSGIIKSKSKEFLERREPLTCLRQPLYPRH